MTQATKPHGKWSTVRAKISPAMRRLLGLTDDQLLEQVFETAPKDPYPPKQDSPSPIQDSYSNSASSSSSSSASTSFQGYEFLQWACEPNSAFRATCNTTRTLPPGTYQAAHDDRGFYFQRMYIPTDSLIVLDDTASQRVVSGIHRFWESRENYSRFDLIYKRGVLLWGPAGSGKTGTVMLLTQELVTLGGIVVMVSEPRLAGMALAQLRRIEPLRPLILVFEDIDELIRAHGEHSILALLDGEYQIANVVSIATTNYPEKLGPRIINRPSRFDERIFIDTPNIQARERYLLHITRNEDIPAATLAAWVQDSAGFSIAHLRELVIAVHCLGQEYPEVVARLKSMQKAVKALDDYPGAARGGFGTQQGALAGQQNNLNRHN